MGDRNQEQTRGRIGSQLRLGNLRVGELHFCPRCHPCTALDQVSSLSRKLAYVPGPTFGFVKLLASSGSHCTKWADQQTSRVRVTARSRPSPPLYPHFNRPSGFWPCVKSCLVGGSDKYYLSIGHLDRFSAFWLGCLAFVPDGWSKPRADSGPNRPPASAGQPSGGRAAFSDPFCTPCIALDLTV